MADLLIRVIGAADGSPTPHDGRYVVAWDSNTEAGALQLTSTSHPEKARRFTFAEATREWNAVSNVEPVRPWDHRPNKPLTAITIEILEFGALSAGS